MGPTKTLTPGSTGVGEEQEAGWASVSAHFRKPEQGLQQGQPQGAMR